MNKKTLFIALACILSLSCKKNGTGGKAEITGAVSYNGSAVYPYTIYIKYGATTSPGTNPADYDNQISITSATNYIFPSLQHGDYYLYAIGNYTEPNLGYIHVAGGTQVHISTTKTTTVTANVTTAKQ